MSIKFPDFQLLVTRSEQVPRPTREGDLTGAAGRMAPQVSQEFADQERRVERKREADRIRDRRDEDRQDRPKQGQSKRQKRPGTGRRIDVRA